MKKAVIYSFYYQPESVFVPCGPYVPVWAGKNGKSSVPGLTGDDTGDNISEKNRYYSELTGIYWAWKNTRADIIGSTHYRRYFTAIEEPLLYRLKRMAYYPLGLWKKRFGLIYTNNHKIWIPGILTQSQLEAILENYDAILPVRRILRKTVKRHYERFHNPNDLVLLEEILSELYPEYLPAYNKVINGNRLFANNMFVLKWEAFDSLMFWLFSVLFTFEERIKPDNYTGYQQRIFGFLSERLITVWILHNNINYKELPLIYFKKLKPDL